MPLCMNMVHLTGRHQFDPHLLLPGKRRCRQTHLVIALPAGGLCEQQHSPGGQRSRLVPAGPQVHRSVSSPCAAVSVERVTAAPAPRCAGCKAGSGAGKGLGESPSAHAQAALWGGGNWPNLSAVIPSHLPETAKLNLANTCCTDVSWG